MEVDYVDLGDWSRQVFEFDVVELVAFVSGSLEVDLGDPFVSA